VNRKGSSSSPSHKLGIGDSHARDSIINLINTQNKNKASDRRLNKRNYQFRGNQNLARGSAAEISTILSGLYYCSASSINQKVGNI